MVAVMFPVAWFPGPGDPRLRVARARTGSARPGAPVRLAEALGLVAKPPAGCPDTNPCPRACSS
eukprot:13705249-Heterocapsa_arctica.AAC.1